MYISCKPWPLLSPEWLKYCLNFMSKDYFMSESEESICRPEGKFKQAEAVHEK